MEKKQILHTNCSESFELLIRGILDDYSSVAEKRRTLYELIYNPRYAIPFAVFDPQSHKDYKYLTEWEEREPMSVIGFTRSFLTMLEDLDEELSFDIISRIRKNLFSVSAYGGYEKYKSSNVSGVSIFGPVHAICPKDCKLFLEEKQDRRLILEEAEENGEKLKKDFFVFLKDNNPFGENDFIENRKLNLYHYDCFDEGKNDPFLVLYGATYSLDVKNVIGLPKDIGRSKIIGNSESVQFVSERYNALIKGEVKRDDEIEYLIDMCRGVYFLYTDSIIVSHVEKLKFIKEKILKFLIERYLSGIRNSDSQEKKLDILLEFVMYSNRVHLFEDFNCRTFSVLVLNRELIRLGFEPVILDDPNVFDFMTLKSLRAVIEKGQANFKYFIKNAKVYDDSIMLSVEDKSYLLLMDDDNYLDHLQSIISSRIRTENAISFENVKRKLMNLPMHFLNWRLWFKKA